MGIGNKIAAMAAPKKAAPAKAAPAKAAPKKAKAAPKKEASKGLFGTKKAAAKEE